MRFGSRPRPSTRHTLRRRSCPRRPRSCSRHRHRLGRHCRCSTRCCRSRCRHCLHCRGRRSRSCPGPRLHWSSRSLRRGCCRRPCRCWKRRRNRRRFPSRPPRRSRGRPSHMQRGGWRRRGGLPFVCIGADDSSIASFGRRATLILARRRPRSTRCVPRFPGRDSPWQREPASSGRCAQASRTSTEEFSWTGLCTPWKEM
jgi:hypothetical protein